MSIVLSPPPQRSKFRSHVKELGQIVHYILLKISGPHPQLPMVQLTLPNESLGTESQRYKYSVIRRGTAAEHDCPEAKRWQPQL